MSHIVYQNILLMRFGQSNSQLWYHSTYRFKIRMYDGRIVTMEVQEALSYVCNLYYDIKVQAGYDQC